MLKNSVFQPSLSASAHLFFFTVQRPFFSFLFQLPFFFASAFFLLFLLAHVFKVQPFTCCSLTQPKSPNVFQLFSPNVFQFFFSPNVFASIQPLFLLLFFCFILFWFSPKMLHSAQNVFFFFFSLGCPLFFSPSVHLKTFFSCFMSLYLSKSSFSSNLK